VIMWSHHHRCLKMTATCRPLLPRSLTWCCELREQEKKKKKKKKWRQNVSSTRGSQFALLRTMTRAPRRNWRQNRRNPHYKWKQENNEEQGDRIKRHQGREKQEKCSPIDRNRRRIIAKR
jgi:hypothetical protein